MRRGLAIFAVIVLVLAGLGLYEFWPDLTSPKGALQEVDLIQVDKSERRMQLLRKGEVVRSYRVSLGANPKGHKQREGDERTPEGRYRIDGRNPRSKFYKSLHISYPNAQDRRSARSLGVSPGGAIMIHGLPNGWGWAGPFLAPLDWTDGCIAVSDAEMDEIWKAVSVGTPIEIRP
jgi:murein L,D-transpeptidase YafK